MPAYAGTVGLARSYRDNNNGKQVGDPEKAITVILKAYSMLTSLRFICLWESAPTPSFAASSRLSPGIWTPELGSHCDGLRGEDAS